MQHFYRFCSLPFSEIRSCLTLITSSLGYYPISQIKGEIHHIIVTTNEYNFQIIKVY
jgi:hypothetical protein